MTRQLEISYSRSVIGCPERQRKTLVALGLRKMHQRVRLPDSPSLRGMLHSIRHLVTWSEIDEGEQQ